jgi:hypothetical protein
MTALEIQKTALNTYPDTDRYKCRIEIRSETSQRIYRISFDAAPRAGYWTCSCPGNIRHGTCKHLKAMGLPGRANGRSLIWCRKFLGHE